MKNTRYNKGFTLVEVMLAAAILVIGLMLVAAAFPVGIKLTAIATERTVGAIVSGEASAKIRLFGDPNDFGQAPFGIDFPTLSTAQLTDFDTTLRQTLDPAEHAYPSADTGETKYYHWSALIKRGGVVGMTANAAVFITRTTGAGAKYPNPSNLTSTISIPKPIPVFVDTSVLPATPALIDEIVVAGASAGLAVHISDGAILVMVNPLNEIQILNVLEVDRTSNTLKLVEAINSALIGAQFWVIPTAENSSRNPCIGVYLETVSF